MKNNRWLALYNRKNLSSLEPTRQPAVNYHKVFFTGVEVAKWLIGYVDVF